MGVNINQLDGNAFTSPVCEGNVVPSTWVEGTMIQAGNYFHRRLTVSGPGDNIVMIHDNLGRSDTDLFGVQLAKVADPTSPTLFRLQFDAGRTVGAAYGPGPGHDVGLFSGNEWNALGSSTTGRYSGTVVDESGNPLVDLNGALVNVTVELAANNGAAPLTNWGNVTVGDWGGVSGMQGVNNTDLMRDALYVSTGSREVMGIRIGGLPAGNYEVLMMPRYGTSVNPIEAAIGVNINQLAGNSLVNPAGTSTLNAWVEATADQYGNYFRKSVFVSNENDWITMIFDNQLITSTEFMGFQIARISVPEPGSLALVVLGVVGLGTWRWGRRRRS